MEKDYLIQLTNNLYRLTLLFPKKEPLRYKTRELADEILAGVIGVRPGSDPVSNPPKIEKKTGVQPLQILENLEILDSFFEVARNQNWVSLSELLAIQKDYSKIKEELEKYGESKKNFEIQAGKSEPSANTENDAKLAESPQEVFSQAEKSFQETIINSRQQKILEILKEKDKTQVWQLKQVFPEVTKRTLRRDIDHLLRQGFVKRTGERNNTFYTLNG